MPTIQEALGIAVKYHQAGQLAQAEQIYRQVLAVDPLQCDAWHLLGVVLHLQGQSDAAVSHIREAIRLKPDLAEAHYNLGNMLREMGKPAEAAAAYQQALEWRPDSPQTLYNLGNALHDLRQFAAAAEYYERALQVQPGYQKALNNLGNCYMDLERHEDAVSCYRRVLEINPSHAKAYANLGNALRNLGRWDEAVEACRKSLELEANNPEALNNLATALLDQGQMEAALEAFDRAIQLRPDYAEARMNRGMAWLQNGWYEQGWQEYEWRWRSKAFVPRGFAQPLWDGSSLEGRTILLHAEQGLGDTLQFLRYVPFVKQRGGRVVLEVHRPLLRLLENFSGADEIVPAGSELPSFDVHAPLLSLPHLLRMPDPAQAGGTAYLHPNAKLRDEWRQRLAQIEGFKVGIHWQGNPKYGSDRQRSLPLKHFLPLAELPGVRLLSLQKNYGIEQLQELPDPGLVLDLGSQLDETSGPFMDTAAVLTSLDLVITCNTALAHLAGAVGAHVWVVLSTAPDWRWLSHGSTTAWYPTMTLLRQSRPGDWEGVMREAASRLEELLARR